MAKQSFTAGQVLTAQQMNDLQTNDFNQTVSTKTDDYTFVVGDRGTRVVANKASAIAFTVDDSIFSAGDTLGVHNINTGLLTLTAGAGVTLNGADVLTVAQYQGGTIFFTSASSAIFFPTQVGYEYETWTPTWTNLTVGNGTQTFSYAHIGQMIHLFGRLVFGSTTSISGLVELTIPTTTSDGFDGILGFAYLTDAGTNDFIGYAQKFTTTSAGIRVGRADITYLTFADTGSTVPFTWTTNDQIALNLVYKGA